MDSVVFGEPYLPVLESGLTCLFGEDRAEPRTSFFRKSEAPFWELTFQFNHSPNKIYDRDGTYAFQSAVLMPGF